jgi:hypothetical protein
MCRTNPANLAAYLANLPRIPENTPGFWYSSPEILEASSEYAEDVFLLAPQSVAGAVFDSAAST